MSEEINISGAEAIRREVQSELLRFVSRNGPLISLLYDLDLLPEQLKEGSKEWAEMMMIAIHWKAQFEK